MANVFLRCLIRPFCLTLKDHPPLASHASRSKAEKEKNEEQQSWSIGPCIRN